MRVLLLGSEPVDYILAFAEGLAETGPVSAILPRARYDHLKDAVPPGVDLDLVDWPRTRSPRNPAFLADLARRIRAHRPDVLHLLSNTTLWLNAAMPFRGDATLVTTIHDVARHPGDRETARLPDWGARLMARQSDHLVVHGPALEQAASRTFGVPRDRVHVLPHPAILRYARLARDHRLVRTRPPDQFVVLLFGRIFAYKGLRTLIRAEAALSDVLPGLRVVIAGRGDDPRAFADEMGRPACYDIRQGFVEDLETARLFTEADVVVLPYDEASQSGVLHVAATFGKPVVVTDVGELGATVAPNDLGLVVPPRSSDALARALLRLSRDPALRQRLGQSALAWAQGPTAPATIGARARALYAELGRRGGPLRSKGCVGQPGA